MIFIDFLQFSFKPFFRNKIDTMPLELKLKFKKEGIKVYKNIHISING
jgi:hypothetical protein